MRIWLIAPRRSSAANESIKMIEHNLPCCYYRVRKGNYEKPPYAAHWCVARWMPQMERWMFGNDVRLLPGHWDEVGERVA